MGQLGKSAAEGINIKAEIIDHLISILPEFKLKVFQYHTASQLCAPQLLK